MLEDVEGVTPAEPTSPSEVNAGEVQEPGKNSSPSGFSTDTKISSTADLQREAPEVYKAMLMGIGQSIIREMREAQERLKEKMREGREDS